MSRTDPSFDSAAGADGASLAPRADDPAPPRADEWERRARPIRITPEQADRLRLCMGDAYDPVADAYRLVRTQLLHNLGERNWRSIAVVGCTPGEGKTLFAINLALSLSRDPRGTVLLVDLDLRRPGVHARLELPAGPGLGDYLRGAAALEDIMLCVDNRRFAVLPCFGPVAGASEILRGEVVEGLVRELAERYTDRIMVYDLPPLLAGDEVIAFLPNVDAVLLVVGEGYTQRSQLERARQLLGGTPIAGIVLNRAATGELVGY